ncbi:MAG: methylmalonyl Co-A mutase-associated GTPase MeaB [Tetrasphaera sp.]
MARAADVPALLTAARSGSVRALARLISRVEAGDPRVPEVLAAAGAASTAAYVIGITGAPGVGKSTTTSALVRALRARGSRVAVLAVDPSSPFTGGALLGDRIRMEEHGTDSGVFIRSMAARGHLGGLAAATPQAIRLLEAAGFDVVLVETVGVGQSEVEVAASADTTLVLLAPGMGDGIQAAKAGLLEVADVLAVNKADRGGARETARELRAMLRLADRPPDAWHPPILSISAADGTGVDDLVDALTQHREHAAADGTLAARRGERARAELEALVLSALRERIAPAIEPYAAAIAAGELPPHTAAAQVIAGLQ